MDKIKDILQACQKNKEQTRNISRQVLHCFYDWLLKDMAENDYDFTTFDIEDQIQDYLATLRCDCSEVVGIDNNTTADPQNEYTVEYCVDCGEIQ